MRMTPPSDESHGHGLIRAASTASYPRVTELLKQDGISSPEGQRGNTTQIPSDPAREESANGDLSLHLPNEQQSSDEEVQIGPAGKNHDLDLGESY